MYLLHNCKTNITSETNRKEILGTRIPYAQTEQLSNGLFKKTIQGGCKILTILYSLGKLANSPNAFWKKSKNNLPLAWNCVSVR